MPDSGKQRDKQLRDRLEASERRKMEARREGDRGVWFGFGMFGIVGWSVAVPTLIGIGVGLWLDSILESTRSWTLVMLLAGVAIGCFNAWYWIKRESERD